MGQIGKLSLVASIDPSVFHNDLEEHIANLNDEGYSTEVQYSTTCIGDEIQYSALVIGRVE